MKKLLLILMALLVSSGIMAQEGKNGVVSKKSFLAFHAGPAFPAGDFNGTQRTLDNNREGGFAKTGFTVNMDYEYQFHKNFSAGAGFFYNRFNLNKTALADQWPNVSGDHWQIYGIAIGPMANFTVADKTTGGVHIMGGLGKINSPAISYERQLMIKGDWKFAGLFQAGGSLRYKAAANLYVLTNLEYMYMHPEFNFESTDHAISQKAKQSISLFNWSAGVGFKF